MATGTLPYFRQLQTIINEVAQVDKIRHLPCQYNLLILIKIIEKIIFENRKTNAYLLL